MSTDLFALRQAILEDLEPRILYSADHPLGVVAGALGDPNAAPEQHASVDATPQTTAATHELVFIDARAPDAGQLLANIAAQAAAGRPIEAVLLRADEDGIDQISAVLAARDDVTAVHLLGHGNDGAMRLGTSWLDADTLLTRAGDIAAWGSHLSADADLLLYGCSFAAEPDGRALVADLAQLTGADVAASTDATGATALGGNWTLEVASGAIESGTAIDAAGQAGYAQVLNTYIVSTTADSGAGSLRQAILDANANAGTDTISFNIAGTGVHTITLATALPSITGTVLIDASTDDSFAANGNRPAIVIDGNGLNTDGLRLTATADGSTIRGLVIRNFGGAAVRIDAGSDGNTVAGNHLGALNASGTYAAAGNGSYVVYVGGANNVIGGSTAADRNVMGSSGAGVYTLFVSGASASGNQILGNYLGVGADGSTVLGAAQAGISVFDAVATRIEGNVIAASGDDGVYLNSAGSGTVIHNNLIGVNAAGTARAGTANNGIWLAAAGAGTVVTDNVIAGASEAGIRLDAAANGVTVQGNRIGTDLAGTANWGTQFSGIQIASSNNLIGGAGAGQGNTIANSNQAGSDYDGIAVAAGTGNALLGNAIYNTVAGTGGIGIDLDTSGATANDSGDGDSGANNLQNFPVLASATVVGGQVTIAGTLNSVAGTAFRIEFFATPSGSGQGRVYLGFTNVTTSGNDASFTATLTASVTGGSVITATATRADAGFTSFTDTSEFSAAVMASDNFIAVTTVTDNNDAGISAGNATQTLTWLAANKGADGLVSLREAIIAANNTANGAGPDRISFSIAGTGVHTIVPTSSLPSITGAVVIDASTDDSFAANGSRPAIVLDGNNLAGDGLTLTSTADGSTIRGFVIRDFGSDGIHIDAGSDGNTIAGNYIGRLDASGNDAGAGEGNGVEGIYVGGANNLIGGSTAADRNVVSGNSGVGIRVTGAAATCNQIAGNYIGLTAAGTAVLGNGDDGVQLIGGASGNTVGGTSSAYRNVISGNADGIQVGHTTGGSNANIIRNNYLGTDATGLIDLGNSSDGVDLWYGSSNNQILDNVVSGNNANGLYIGNSVGSNTGTVIRGNLIGLGADGVTALGNGGDGINLGDGAVADNTVVGGTLAGQGNTVAYNARGIAVLTSTGISILGNLVYANTGLGIDLGASGVTANDTGDADTGANNLQNFPVLSLVKTTGSQIEIRGTLNSTAGASYRIEFYAKPASGNGMIALGFANAATDGSGNASFATTLAAAVPVGYTVTATATRSDAGYASFTDTSEYAAALDAGTTPVNTVPGAKTLTEDQSGAIAGLSVVDGGVLTMTSSLSVLHGALTVSLAGGATIASGANGGGALTLSGTTAQVNAALATLSYLATANYNGSDTLTMLSTDASGLSDSDTVAITVTAVNDAPVLGAIAPTLGTLNEDQATNGGQTVASIVASSIADVDAGAVQGMAVTGLVSGTGTWQYSTDGGSSWTAVGAVSGSSALLLRSTDLVRFVPNGQNATSGSITYRAWDQTGGSAGSKVDASSNGGATAFSTSTDTASLTVTAVNDAPVLGIIAPTLTSINEDQTSNGGQTVASFIGSSFTDVDTGAVQGIAITGLVSNTGAWQYSTDGGSSWTAVGAVSGSSALLLRPTDLVRFVPDAQNATTGSLTYRAWDQTSGSAGSKVDASTNGGTTAFSTSTDTASITVTAINDAPVLTATAPTLSAITEDQTTNSGQTVASFIGVSITDVDTGAAKGIAITSLTSGTGAWQYSTDGGTTWAAVGTVGNASALLLRATDSLRFVPDGQNTTAGSLTYRAWDQTSGSVGSKVDASATGGTTAFSSGSDTASITVTAVNDAPVLGALAPTFTSITEDQTANGGQTVASFLGASITEVDSGAVQGIAITGLNSGTGTWQFSADGGSTWFNVGAVSESSALLLRPSDAVRFVPDGQNATTGSITYRAWDQTSGSAGSKVDASTTGGATAFSSSSDTASITVTAVNDAPVLGAIAPTMISITEDQTVNAGQTVASFIGASITDVDSGAVQGIAITALTLGTGTWQYSTDGGSSWAAIGAVGNSSALLLRSTDSVRFVPDGQNATNGSLTYRAWDQTSGSAGGQVDVSVNGGASAFSSSTDTSTIVVTAVNDSPVLAATTPTLSSITEDQTSNAGQTVASIVGASITDVDSGAVQGIAITGLSSGTGTWQFSTDGGSNWVSVGAVGDSSALLLRATDFVRLVPDGQNATSGSITYRAWDQTRGSAGSTVDASSNGGTAAFSTASDTASITVTALNDAPVLGAIAPTLTTLTEDQTANPGQTVASFLGNSITDVDGGAVQGIAITGLSAGTGPWEFSTDGGTSWSVVGGVSDASALLLRSTDSVRFVPDGRNDTTGSITFRAWDQTTGVAGTASDASLNGGTTAFSAATDTASITVTAVNDAPVLTATAPVLSAISEDQTANAGQTVASFVGSSIADVDSGALQGIAITALASGTGAWQYSTDSGASWSAIGAVSDSSALLLRSTDSIRFVPDGLNATTGALTYQAWDQTSGSAGTQADANTTGGTTAFSTATDTASISVTAVNDAPLLTATAPTLNPITEDATADAGQTVASFIGASIGDVDNGALQGIAVTAVDAGNGAWQFSIDGGASWSGIGAVSDSSALLLRATDAIRFVPDGRNGASVSLTYRAWDRSAGTAGMTVDASTFGGATAFSSGTDTAALAVAAVNDAPMLSPVAPVLATLRETDTANSGQSVASFIGASIDDVDAGALPGIAIVGADAGNGSWQFSTDGGASWVALGAVSDSAALLLRATDSIRFLPDGANGTAGSITYRAWDQTAGSAGATLDASAFDSHGALSSATDTASITVSSVNTAPVLTPAAPVLAPLTEDQIANAGHTVASIVGNSIADVDAGALQGIAITAADAGNGTWQVSLDAGGSWAALGPVGDSAALLLRATDSVRFVPNGLDATSGHITYRAWDQTSGLAGTLADASASGGETAFSSAVDTASITVSAVNDAPVLAAFAPALASVNEDEVTNAGQTVASIIGSSATDVDGGSPAPGIAITATGPGNGRWQYATDGGTLWAEIGGVDDGAALLLRATDLVRFVPDGANGTTGTFAYRAWDGTAGLAGDRADTRANGGSSAFSVATDTATIQVADVADAPVIAPGPSAFDVAEHSTGVAAFSATDIDRPAQALTWSIAGGADAARFAIDAATGALRFVVAPDVGTSAAADGGQVYQVVVQVGDGTLTDTRALAVTVTPVNVATPPAVPPVAPPAAPPPAAPPAEPPAAAPAAPPAAAPTPVPDVTPSGAAAHSATSSPPAPATPGSIQRAPAPAAVASPAPVAASIAEPPAPRPPGGAANEAASARALTVATARPSEALARALAAITLPSHRVALDITMLALNPLALGQQVAHSDNHAQYSAELGTGSAEPPPADDPLHSTTTIAIGLALSIGVIGWASRGAALMASVLVASPAWGGYDLLPVLRRRSEDADWGDDDAHAAGDAPLGETDLSPLDATASTTRRDHDILELH